ncbi:MAG TPA: haloacid dehalogenase, partial [Actinomycetota bacterium]|nr:haloacid dehalogenase [Actinomycetota bacterium]
MDLSAIAADIRKRFEAKSSAREQGLHSSRAAIRFCANSIRAVHRGEMDVARDLQRQAREQLDIAQDAMRPFPEIYYAGFLHDAEKEYA